MMEDQKLAIVKQHITEDFFKRYHEFSNFILQLPITKDAQKLKVYAQNHLNDCYVWVKAELLPALEIKPQLMEVMDEMKSDELELAIKKA